MAPRRDRRPANLVPLVATAQLSHHRMEQRLRTPNRDPIIPGEPLAQHQDSVQADRVLLGRDRRVRRPPEGPLTICALMLTAVNDQSLGSGSQRSQGRECLRGGQLSRSHVGSRPSAEKGRCMRPDLHSRLLIAPAPFFGGSIGGAFAGFTAFSTNQHRAWWNLAKSGSGIRFVETGRAIVTTSGVDRTSGERTGCRTRFGPAKNQALAVPARSSVTRARAWANNATEGART